MPKLTPDQITARKRDAFTARFADAASRMDNHSPNVASVIIIDPASPKDYGRITWTHAPRSGVLLHAVAWMPGHRTSPDNAFLHVGKCDRTNYGPTDAHTEALAGARYRAPDGTVRTIDTARDWQAQLEAAGLIVARAV